MGATGATGPSGAGGLSDYQIVSGSVSANSTTSPKTATATCPSGTSALGGGGVTVNNGSGTLSLTNSYPSSSTVWTVTAARQSGSGNWTVQAYVVCASVSA
jgi:hypothetical protein